MLVQELYQLPINPLILKQLMIDCDIFQEDIAINMGVSRPTINLVMNRAGYIPKKGGDFKKHLEAYLSSNPAASQWLINHGLKIGDIWQPLGKSLYRAHSKSSWQPSKKRPQLVSGDPEVLIKTWEVEAMHPDVMRHFKLFRDPFLNDVNSEKDIFMSDEHRYIEAVMMDTALHSGFIAVIGEVQSGKSVIRKKVMENLKRDGNVVVIYPRSRRINVGDRPQSRINAVSLCDAIILDISDETPKIKTEHKVRQLERLLIARSNQGQKHVLVIEEAQNLTPVALKYLKQFYELEDGFKKLLGIILIGQTELKYMLDETRHVDMREVIRRVQVAEIHGLNGNLREYLEFKFKRVGADIKNVFDEAAFDALSRRLTIEDHKKRKISQAYPGLVNTYATKAMNLAFEIGEAKVTEDVIHTI